MTTPLSILRQARDLLQDPACWTQGHYARKVHGYGTTPQAVDAVCWCAEGALAKFASPSTEDAINSSVVDEILLQAFKALTPIGYTHVWEWNDAADTKHSDVLARFDAVIADLEASL